MNPVLSLFLCFTVYISFNSIEKNMSFLSVNTVLDLRQIFGLGLLIPREIRRELASLVTVVGKDLLALFDRSESFDL